MRRRRAAIVVSLAAATTGALALFAHALVARGGAACPVGDPSPARLERQRAAAAGTLRGEGTAPADARKLAGYALGESTLGRVREGEGAAGATCEEEIAGALLRCTRGEESELVARFAPSGKLVGLDRVTNGLDPARAVEALAARRTEAARWGAPRREWGETTAAGLAAPLRQAGFEHRFEDVAVDVTVTNLSGGIVLREQRRDTTASGGT